MFVEEILLDSRSAARRRPDLDRVRRNDESRRAEAQSDDYVAYYCQRADRVFGEKCADYLEPRVQKLAKCLAAAVGLIEPFQASVALGIRHLQIVH